MNAAQSRGGGLPGASGSWNWRARMKRGLAALACAGLLLASLPATVGAARVTKGSDHFVYVSCDMFFDGGYVNAYAEHSAAFGDFASLDLWLDPAIPFEDPSAASRDST